jgi:hypothetical protein
MQLFFHMNMHTIKLLFLAITPSDVQILVVLNKITHAKESLNMFRCLHIHMPLQSQLVTDTVF